MLGFGSLRRNYIPVYKYIYSFAIIKTLRKKAIAFTGSGALTHARSNTQDLHGRLVQVVSVLKMPYSQTGEEGVGGYHTNGPKQAPDFTKKKKERQHNTTWLHCSDESALMVTVPCVIGPYV